MAMRPELLARQAETEELTHYPKETHDAFLKAGFYRMLVPKMFGGHECGLPAFYRVVTEIARGCPSTGWCLSLGAAHALQVGTLYDRDVQAELFGDGDFRCASTTVVTGAVAEPDGDEHVVIDGTWGYCSGAPWATHVLAQAFRPPSEPGGRPGPLMLFTAPRALWSLVDDWHGVLGLRGSGSHSVRFDRARVPVRYLADGNLGDLPVEGGSPGSRLHGNPLYAGRTFSFFQGELAAVIVGAAYATADEYARILADRPLTSDPGRTRAELYHYQILLGEALAGIHTAHAALQYNAQDWMECARRNVSGEAPFTMAEDDRLTIVFLRAARLAFESMQDIVRTAGSRHYRDGARMQRYVRDVLTWWTHAAPGMMQPFAERVGRARLGLPPEVVPLVQ